MPVFAQIKKLEFLWYTDASKSFVRGCSNKDVRGASDRDRKLIRKFSNTQCVIIQKRVHPKQTLLLVNTLLVCTGRETNALLIKHL